MLEVDLAFPHSYEVEEIPELPGTGKFDVPVLYFPRPKNRPEHDGLWLKIRTASGKSWVGVFAFGYQSPPAFSRVVSFPNQDRACIISRGAGNQAISRFDRWSIRRYFANNSRVRRGAGRAPESGRGRVVSVYSASIHNNSGTSNSPTKD